jgi:hypothetical protein
MPLILVTSTLVLIALPFLVIERYWLFSIGLYVWFGLKWINYDKKIDISARPLYVGQPITRYLMVLGWPIRLYIGFMEYFHFRKCRFKAIFGKGGTESRDIQWKTFQSYSDAVSFARVKTNDTEVSHPILVSDQISHKMYVVGSDGEVRDSPGAPGSLRPRGVMTTLWPQIADHAAAIWTSRQGIIATGASSIVTGLTTVLGVFDIARLIYAVLFAILAIGIYRMSRAAAVAALAAYLLGRVPVWYSHGFPANIIELAVFVGLTLLFINGIRGTFAYHRLRQDS